MLTTKSYLIVPRGKRINKGPISKSYHPLEPHDTFSSMYHTAVALLSSVFSLFGSFFLHFFRCSFPFVIIFGRSGGWPRPRSRSDSSPSVRSARSTSDGHFASPLPSFPPSLSSSVSLFTPFSASLPSFLLPSLSLLCCVM